MQEKTLVLSERNISKSQIISSSSENVDDVKSSIVLDNLTQQSTNKYATEKTIGEGAMKYILKVKDKDTARSIAMAIMLNPDSDIENAERFIKEAQITANLEHPNIVPVHEIGIDASKSPYFTMKLINGENLAIILQKLDQGQKEYIEAYPLSKLLEIFQKICDAISFAHSKGVIHLDLKPENIQIGEYGEVLVLDWGLAKITNEDTDNDVKLSTSIIEKELPSTTKNLTLDGVVKGTLGYMAPEQARGKNSKKDYQTDIYALGAILYTILTYKISIKKQSVNEMLIDTAAGNVEYPSKRTPDLFIPHALEAVAMKAMSVDHAQRYSCVLNLKNDINSYISGFATNAENANFITILLLLLKRHKKVFTVGLLSSIIIIVILALSIRKIQKTWSKFQLEQLHRLEISKQAAPEYVAKGDILINTGNWTEAKKTNNIAIALDKNLKEAWYQKGRLFLGEKEFASALIAFKKSGNIGNEKIKRLTQKYYKLSLSKDNITLENQKVSLPLELKEADDIAVSAYLYKDIEGVEALKARLNAAKYAIIKLNKQVKKLRFSVNIKKNDIKVSLANNKNLTDISPLRGIPITNLDLSYTNISDISTVKEMPLTYLNLNNSKVSKLDDIGDIITLKNLCLNYLDIEKLDNISNLNLKQLSLRNTKISSVELLQNMPLEHLDIGWSEVNDIQYLRSENLIKLSINNTKIDDISVLAESSLEYLNASYAKIKDLTPLKGLNCSVLYLKNNHITNIDALKDMPLVTLDISHNPIREILALKGLPISSLMLGDTQVDDLSPLVGMKLDVLDLSYSKIYDYKILSEFLTLQSLNLSNSLIKDLAPVQNLKLKKLNLYNTKISHLHYINKDNLESLDIRKCLNIKNFKMLMHTRKLKDLKMDKNLRKKVEDLKDKQVKKNIKGGARRR